MNSLEQENNVERLAWFINLRWVAFIGGVSLLTIGRYLVPLDIKCGRLTICVVLLGFLNGIYFIFLKKLKLLNVPEVSLLKRESSFLHLQMIVDLILLTIILYLSGGVGNPVMFFFLFHLAISAIIFSIYESLIYLVLALGLPWLLYFAEHLDPSTSSLWGSAIGLPEIYEKAILLGYSITVVGLWFFLSRLALAIRSKESALGQIQDRLIKANEGLEQLELYKSQFLRQIIFQLKKPAIDVDFDLSTVEKSIPQNAEKALLVIRTAKKRIWALLELIEDLAWISRIEAGEIPLQREWVNVYEILLNQIQTKEADAKKRGIYFKLHGDQMIRLKADREAFQRVTENLLSNAVKYTPAGPHSVLVEFKTEGDWLVLSVQDEGIGIPPKQQKKIFEEFFRASNAKNLEKFGTGLGLTIVKRILDWHGGKVRIVSASKQGTKVETFWPISALGKDVLGLNKGDFS